MKDWLRQHAIQVHLLAFLLMILTPVPLDFAARQGAAGRIWALVALVIAGNVLIPVAQ